MLSDLYLLSAFIIIVTISTYVTIEVTSLDDKYSLNHCIQQNDQNNDSTVCINKVFNYYSFPFVINDYNDKEDISSSEKDDTKVVDKDDDLYLISAGMRRKNLFVVEVDVYRVGKYNNHHLSSTLLAPSLQL
jgi:hypothetical protein